MTDKNNDLIKKRMELQKIRYAETNKKKYEKRLDNMILCNACNCSVDPYYWKTHTETEKHKENLQNEQAEKKIITCETCCTTINANYLKRHLETPKHKYYQALEKQ